MSLRHVVGVVFGLMLLAYGCGAFAQPASNEKFYLVGPLTPSIVPYVLEFLKNTPYPEIVINGPGGNLDSAVEISEAIKAKKNVTCTVRGFAASGHFAILEACRTRRMTSKSILLTHAPKVAFPGYLDELGVADVLNETRKTTREWAERCRARLRVTREQYDAKTRGTDWRMNAQEAYDVGAVDIVLP